MGKVLQNLKQEKLGENSKVLFSDSALASSFSVDEVISEHNTQDSCLRYSLCRCILNHNLMVS